jgi:hypothetical protein
VKLQDLYEARQANLPKEERKPLPKRPDPLTGSGRAGNGATSGGHSNGSGAHSGGGNNTAITITSLTLILCIALLHFASAAAGKGAHWKTKQ